MLLLGTPTSPYVRIVRMAAIQRGLDGRIETRFVPTRSPDSPVNAYNPTGKVPTLVLDSGEALSETRLVCAYLDTLHDGDPIVEEQATHAARAFEGVCVGFLDGIAVWAREMRRPEGERSPAILVQEHDRAERCIAFFEARAPELAEPSTYPLLCLLVGLWRFERLGLVLPQPGWRETAPALARWYASATARPEFAATAPA